MQLHNVHHGVAELVFSQIQCWLSSPQGEFLFKFTLGPRSNLAASHR